MHESSFKLYYFLLVIHNWNCSETFENSFLLAPKWILFHLGLVLIHFSLFSLKNKSLAIWLDFHCVYFSTLKKIFHFDKLNTINRHSFALLICRIDSTLFLFSIWDAKEIRNIFFVMCGSMVDNNNVDVRTK